MSDIENLAKKLGNQNPIIYPREKSKEINNSQKDMRKKKKFNKNNNYYFKLFCICWLSIFCYTSY